MKPVAEMTDAERREKLEKEERNKANALAYYQTLMGDIDYDKAESYMGQYIQHDPEVAGNGMKHLRPYLETDPKFKDRKKKTVEFSNVLADGDYVYFQLRNELPSESDNMKALVQHLFRFDENGKIEEHWATITTVHVDESVNPSPLY